jgi:hypothetical protein
MSHLMRASRNKPSLDVGFMIYQAHQAAASGGAGGSRMNALSRVAFEKHLVDARKHVLVAMKAQSAFWAALQSPAPKLAAIHGITRTLYTSMRAAELAFTELLAINSQSLVVLRLFADFCLYVANDTTRVS